ncbi:molybdate ABC transporter substrate-binding protein [Nannocystaceae bacterium ST9]
MRPRTLALPLALLLAQACKPSERTTVTVFAAASLTESFAAIEAAFEAEHPELDVVLVFAGSQLLATQLLEGAQAEVFASANPEQIDRVGTGRELAERRVFTTNRLVLVVRDEGEIRTLDQLTGEGVRVVLAGEAVPAGKYAREALAELGMRDEVMANVVSNELDVRGVIAKLRAGEADAGIAYATDLRGSEDVLDAIELAVEVDARYELAVLADSSHPSEGKTFAAFVSSEAGQAILHEHGFSAVAHHE